MKKTFKLKIKINQSECWYGGLVSDGKKMPYLENQSVIDLSKENHQNQATSLFVSTQGRYIYNQQPFKYFIKNKIIFIESENEIKVKETNDKTLKSAVRAIYEKYFSKIHQKNNLSIFDEPQYNTWIELGHDINEKAVLEYVQSIIDNDFPKGLIIIDDNWQRDYGVWEFDKNRFSSPKKMIEKIHECGFKVSLWVCPFVSADSTIYRELAVQDYLIKGKDGKTKIIKWWNGYSACLDLTNPKAYAWLLNSLKKLQKEYSIDGFKFDAGDFEFYKDTIFYDESNQSSQAKRLTELASQFSINETRVSFNGQEKALVQRLADKNHSWKNNGIDSIIPDALAASVLGYKIICPDMIGGGDITSFGKNKIDQELYIRYCQVSAFFPIMQFSLLPWNAVSKSNLEIVREAVKIHQNIVKYIKEIAVNAVETGDPLIRPLEYEYPHQEYEYETAAFMLGENYVVVPMVEKGKTHRIFRLPEGTWKNEKGIEFIGGKNVPVNSPISTISFFEKVVEEKEGKTTVKKKAAKK